MDIDDDDDTPPPVFRHFTRDDLADIHHLMFENKLIEKKKAEKLAKNKAVRDNSCVMQFRDIIIFIVPLICNILILSYYFGQTSKQTRIRNKLDCL